MHWKESEKIQVPRQKNDLSLTVDCRENILLPWFTLIYHRFMFPHYSIKGDRCEK